MTTPPDLAPDSRTDAQIESEPRMLQPEEMTKTTRVINKGIYAALAIILFGLGLLAYWAFGPSDVLTITNVPVPVRTIREHPTADGVVILRVDYCKHIEATGQGRISFVAESREIFLPEFEEDGPAGCQQGIELPVLIPHEIPPARYKVKFRTEYQLNPIRNVVEEFDSIEFEVKQ